MWARARYHLRLSSDEFWRLTPRQYHLLWEEHRERLIHDEMLLAWHPSAIRPGFASFAGVEGVSALDYMPTHRHSRRIRAGVKGTPEQQRAYSGWLAKRAQLAAEMRAGKGLCLDKVKRGEMI